MRIILLLFVFFLSVNISHSKDKKKRKKNWIDVIFISNQDDSLKGFCKEHYYYENSFTSFGYYDYDGNRQRVHADEYKKILIKDIYFESVALKSTVKKDCKRRVFLTRLIDGAMIMYHYHYVKGVYPASKCIDEIYIRKADEECAYPIYKEACQSDIGSVSQPKNYKDMMVLFQDTPEIIDKIESGEYRRENFEEIGLEYNRLKTKN